MAATAARTGAVARDLHDTVRTGSLEVDRAPVTNGRYATFVAATGHRPPLYWPKGECPPSLLRHPVTGVDFFDALAFALWSGGSIPTEDEWVAAGGLEEPSAYVWGDFFDSKRCNTAKSGVRGTTPVDAYPEGTAPSGCVDLCGNVWEMTCTAFPGNSDSIIVKGGSWSDLPAHARLDTQFRTRVNKGSSNVGFRLVYGVPGLLPYFVDRALVDQCIAFRRADAPHFDAQGDASEFEAIVESLRETAGPHLARLEAESRAALVSSDMGAPAPAAPPFRRRLVAAAREIGNASFWRKIMPVLRVFAHGSSLAGRFRAASAEARRPRRGPPLRQALAAAAVALFPDRGRAFRARLRASVAELFRAGGPSARFGRAYRVLLGRRPSTGRALVTVRPPATALRSQEAARQSLFAKLAKRPRRIFLLLCIFAGSVLGLLGTMMRDRKGPERAPAQARAVPTDPEPRQKEPAPAPPKASTAEAAPRKELPSTTKELTPEDVEAVMRRLADGRPQERDEAERFLIWHRAETEVRVREALASKLEPRMREALGYVAAAIDEEKGTRNAGPTFLAAPPRRGLVLLCDSLDSAEDIAVVRRTAKAARLELTVVLTGVADAARVANRSSDDLGDVKLYVDTDGSYAKGLRIERLPAVAGLREGQGTAFLAYGRVQRSRLGEQVTKLGEAR